MITFNCTSVFLIFVYLLKIYFYKIQKESIYIVILYKRAHCSMMPSVILLSVCVPRWRCMINWSRSIMSASVLRSVFKDRTSISISSLRRVHQRGSTFRDFIARSRRPWKCLLNLWMYVRIVYPERNNPVVQYLLSGLCAARRVFLEGHRSSLVTRKGSR